MKIKELQTNLENLQNDLCIISQTSNAIGSSLDEGVLTVEQISWALFGITKSTEESVKNVERLVAEIIKMRKVLESL